MAIHLPRLGLRCEAMTICGILWCLFGLGVLTGASDPPDGLVFTMIPAWLRGAVWIVTGAGAFAAGITGEHTSRALGWLMLMPLLRCVSYAWGSILALIPGVQAGEYGDGWFTAGVYGVQVLLVIYLARIPPGIMRDGTWRREVVS